MHLRVEITSAGEPSRGGTVEGPSITLGRDPACQLPFDGKLHDAVSWHHARIDLSETGCSVTDLESSNGTFVNGEQVKGSRPLARNDVIGLGQTGPKVRIVELGASAKETPKETPKASPGAQKMLPGGMLTPPHGTSPLNVSSDSQPARPKRRRSPMAGVALGVLAIGAVAAAGYVVFTSQGAKNNSSQAKNETDKKDDANDKTPDPIADKSANKTVDKTDGVAPPTKDAESGKVPPLPPDPKPEIRLPTSQEIYRQTLKSTGWIRVPRPFGLVSEGTGALVDSDKRLFLTAAHVADGGKASGNASDKASDKAIKVYFPKYEGEIPIAERNHYLDKEVPVVADVVIVDRGNDLAVLRLRNIPEGVVPLPVAPKGASVADRIHTVGNPGASEALWSYTEGSVRQVAQKTMRLNNGWTLKAWTIVAQFPINQGDSGGPVVNVRGELVGVNSSLDPGAQLVSHCIDLREILPVLERAKAKDE